MLSNISPVFTGRVVQILQGLRWQFDETPGLVLSVDEASVHWPLSPANLLVLFETLVDVGYLERVGDGRYRRRADLVAH